jgi:hypothetical protein
VLRDVQATTSLFAHNPKNCLLKPKIYVNIYVYFHSYNERSLNLGCLHPVECVRSGDGVFFIRLRNVTIVG